MRPVGHYQTYQCSNYVSPMRGERASKKRIFVEIMDQIFSEFDKFDKICKSINFVKYINVYTLTLVSFSFIIKTPVRLD